MIQTDGDTVRLVTDRIVTGFAYGLFGVSIAMGLICAVAGLALTAGGRSPLWLIALAVGLAYAGLWLWVLANFRRHQVSFEADRSELRVRRGREVLHRADRRGFDTMRWVNGPDDTSRRQPGALTLFDEAGTERERWEIQTAWSVRNLQEFHDASGIPRRPPGP